MQGFSYKLAHGQGLVAAPTAKRVTLDAGAMSATCIFATDALDRVGDIINIPGIRTQYHQISPIVLWNHGKELSLPIGKTVNADGQYTVAVGDHEALQTTFFSQSLLEAEQIYRLIEEGIIGANSIGYRTLKAKRLPANPKSLQKPGLYLEEVELLECSWVGVGANQEAVRSILAKSMVGGKSLASALRHTFQQQLLPSNPVVRGGFMATKELEEIAADGTTTESSEELPKPFGAEALATIHQCLLDCLGYGESVAGRLDNDKAKKVMAKAFKNVLKALEEVSNGHNDTYPEQAKLAVPQSKEEDADGSEDVVEEKSDESEEEKKVAAKSYAWQLKAHLRELAVLTVAPTTAQQIACKYFVEKLEQATPDFADHVEFKALPEEARDRLTNDPKWALLDDAARLKYVRQMKSLLNDPTKQMAAKHRAMVAKQKRLQGFVG